MHKRSLWVVSFAFLLWLGIVPTRADGVTLEENSSDRTFKVFLNNASVADLLRAVQSKYGVEVRGLEDFSETDPVTANFSGTLPSILNRLLRNENFSVVRSDANPTGVLRILISPTKASPNKGTQPPAKNQPPNQY
jgi:hypothetical protein